MAAVYTVGQHPILFRVRLLDTDNPYNPQPVDLTDLESVSVGFRKPDGTTVLKAAEIVEEGTRTPATGAALKTADIVYDNNRQADYDLLDQTGLWSYVGVARTGPTDPMRVLAGTTPTYFWVQAQV